MKGRTQESKVLIKRRFTAKHDFQCPQHTKDSFWGYTQDPGK